jgi:hypothetical protein
VIPDFVIIRPALLVCKDGAAKGEGHGARPGGSVLMVIVSPVSRS